MNLGLIEGPGTRYSARVWKLQKQMKMDLCSQRANNLTVAVFRKEEKSPLITENSSFKSIIPRGGNEKSNARKLGACQSQSLFTQGWCQMDSVTMIADTFHCWQTCGNTSDSTPDGTMQTSANFFLSNWC
jgi:hypothetical protein